VAQSEYIGSYTPERATITSNVDTSPEGVVNATSFVEDSATGRHRTQTAISVTSGSTYTLSMFAKIASGSRLLCLNADFLFNARAYFDLVNGDVEGTDSGSASIEDYGNGWYRCSITGTSSYTGTSVAYLGLEVGTSDSGYAGDGTSGHYWYGIQVEAASYPTSYIPTYGTAASRAADIANLTDGIPNMIGKNTFTFFYDCIITTPRNGSGTFSHLDIDGIIGIKGASNTSIRVHCIGSVNFSTSVPILDLSSGRHKFAITMNSNGIGHYFVDGVKQSGEITYSGSGFTGDDCKIDGGAYNQNGNQLLVFPTALTDAECIALTTI
jgi:hypothetical protein